MKRLGKEMIPSVVDGEMVFLVIGGHKVGFRVRDRLLVCPVCGNLSKPPSSVCHGCENNRPLVDPLSGAGGAEWTGAFVDDSA